MLLKWVPLLLFLLIAFPLKAKAYVDFGTGSVLVQSVIASIVGVLFFFKDMIFNLVKKIFKK